VGEEGKLVIFLFKSIVREDRDRYEEIIRGVGEGKQLLGEQMIENEFSKRD